MLKKFLERNSEWQLEQKNVFTIIGMMRSGSNFIERALDSADDVTCYGELFNPTFIGLHHKSTNPNFDFKRGDIERRDNDVKSFAKKLFRHTDTSNVGFRIFFEHNRLVIEEVLQNSKIKKIVLRRNLLNAYVSLQRAVESGQWLAADGSRVKEVQPVTINFNKFVLFVCQHKLFFEKVFNTLRETGQDYVMIDYSEMKEPEKINELLEFIGSKERMDDVVEKTARQNTLSIEQSIANFEEFEQKLNNAGIKEFFLDTK